MNLIKSGEPPSDAPPKLRQVWPSQQSLPLTDQGVSELLAVAADGDHLDRLIVRGILYSGVNPGTMAHMRPGWIEHRGGQLVLSVPGGEIECDVGKGKRGKSTQVKVEPCWQCKDYGDGYWSLRSSIQPRRIPIVDEPTAELIDSYFHVHDRVAVPETVKYRIRTLGEEVGFEQTLSGMNLRMTFGRMLADREFNGESIRQIMGHKPSAMGRQMTVRYFGLSDEWGIPPYRCGAELTESTCRQTVKFPTDNCFAHK